MRKHTGFATHPTAAPTIPAVTIGLDLSDKTTHWCALDQAGNVSGRGQLRLTRAELRKHFTDIPPARMALEASGQSAWIAVLLASLGHEVLVANPRELKSISGSPRKSDPRDAEQLARVDPALLHPIRHRRPARRFDLLIIRSRAGVVECRTRKKARLRSELIHPIR